MTSTNQRTALRNTTNQSTEQSIFRTKTQAALQKARDTASKPGGLNKYPLRHSLRSATNQPGVERPLKPSRPVTRGQVKAQPSITTGRSRKLSPSRQAALRNEKENIDPICNDERMSICSDGQSEDVHMASIERQQSVSSYMHAKETSSAYGKLLVDPFLCPDYIEDIYAYLRAVEKTAGVKKHYLSVHKRELAEEAITPRMRGITVDWLMQVAIRFQLGIEAAHLSVQLMDRFLTATMVPKCQLQLTAVSCLMIACKYEEVSTPTLDDYVYLTANSVTGAEVLELERAILRQLDFKLGVPLSIHFVRRYSFLTHAPNSVHTTAKYLCETLLMEYFMCHLPPSRQAAACVWLARYAYAKACKDCQFVYWPAALETASGLRQDEVTPWVRHLAGFAIKMMASTCKTTAMRTKYESSKYSGLNLLTEEVCTRLVDDRVEPQGSIH